jgi:predicted RNase H-like HicB family nuclease
MDALGGPPALYTLKVHRERHDSFKAEVAELPGCFTSGRSLDEVRGQARVAVEILLESLREPPASADGAEPRPGPVEFELIAV